MRWKIKKSSKPMWEGYDNGKKVGTIILNITGTYSLVFLRGDNWGAVFKTELSLITAKQRLQEYYELHKGDE